MWRFWRMEQRGRSISTVSKAKQRSLLKLSWPKGRQQKLQRSHRSRFDNVSRPNYQRAAKKCLVIIGKLESVRKHVREVQGGIEVVGLTPNEGHVAYRVCVKEGEGVVEFIIKCDRVAKKLISLNKDPCFEPAQRLQSISPGWVALKQMSSMTYMYLRFMMRTAVGLLQSRLLSFWRVVSQDLSRIKLSSLAPCKVLLKPRPKPFGSGNFARTSPVSKPRFKSRLFCSMYRFPKLLKKMPFNDILPRVQSINIAAFLSSALFPKQNTIRVMVVHGMFLLSCRIKVLGKICDRQCFVDWHILCVVQEFSG